MPFNISLPERRPELQWSSISLLLLSSCSYIHLECLLRGRDLLLDVGICAKDVETKEHNMGMILCLVVQFHHN
jgi:hypothetical protein